MHGGRGVLPTDTPGIGCASCKVALHQSHYLLRFQARGFYDVTPLLDFGANEIGKCG